MCGLTGFSGHMPADPNKIKILLLENEIRGDQSTGIYGKKLMKKSVKASDFISDVNFEHIASNHFVIGHTRQPTSSNRAKQHAHPFVIGKKNEEGFVIGAHNGSIFNEYELEQKIEGYVKPDVDSESIFQVINLKKDPTAFTICEGHMAITFYYNGYIFLYRRESRPLFLGKTREGYYWSSRKEGLKKLSIPDEKIFDLRPHRLLVLKGSKIVEKIEMPKPRIEADMSLTSYNWENRIPNELREELTGKKYFPVTHQVTQVAGTEKQKDTHQQTSSKISKTTTDIPLWRAEELKTTSPIRIMSASDMKMLGVPKLFGKNICLSSDTKLTSREFSSFVMSECRRVNTKCSIHFNFFSKDPTTPFWISDRKNCSTVFKSDMLVFPQHAAKLEPSVVDCVVIDLKFLLFNGRLNTLMSPHRDSLYAFIKFDESKINNAENSFNRDAVSYCPVVHGRRDEENDGYLRINVPRQALVEGVATSNSLRIAIVDLRHPGFMFESIIRIEQDSHYKFTIVADVEKENEFYDGRISNKLEVVNTDDSGSIEERVKAVYRMAKACSDSGKINFVQDFIKGKASRGLIKSEATLESFIRSGEEQKKRDQATIWD